MSLLRVPPIVQSVAHMRNWVVQHVPGTDSMPGYDLFLKLANDLAVNQAAPILGLGQGMPYPLEVIGDALSKFEQHGLVALSNDADRGLTVRATERFVQLLDEYSLAFESVFIVRTELRAQQLVVQSGHAELATLARVLYDRVYDLGWLYLHNFGAACFLMASIVRRIAELHGKQARIVSCHVEIEGRNPDGSPCGFRLGSEGTAKPGQIDGHAVCVIEDVLVVDYGLGNVRKGYRRDFYWGAIGDYQRDGAAFARLALPGGETMTWKDDWQSPHGEAELAKYAPHLDSFAADYLRRFR
jgi:hypothetical protein